MLLAHLETQRINQCDKCGAYKQNVGWDSSVGIAAHYKLDGSGIESR
jgi:hypothetical protein